MLLVAGYHSCVEIAIADLKIQEKEDELEDHTESRDIRVLNANSMTIIDLEGIPSSA